MFNAFIDDYDIFYEPPSDTYGESIDEQAVREKAETMLDAIISSDHETAYGLFSDAAIKTDFYSTYDQINSDLSGVSSYKLIPMFRYKSKTNSESTTMLRYYMTTNNGNYVVDAEISDSHGGLHYFSITPEAQTRIAHSGNIKNMKGSNAFQWLMLAFAVAETIFVIIVFVDCCRRKLRLKLLWIILILVGIHFSVSIVVPYKDFNFSLGSIANYSSLIIYGDGSSLFRLFVPSGAILYLAFRKIFTIKPDIIEVENATIEDAAPTEE